MVEPPFRLFARDIAPIPDAREFGGRVDAAVRSGRLARELAAKPILREGTTSAVRASDSKCHRARTHPPYRPGAGPCSRRAPRSFRPATPAGTTPYGSRTGAAAPAWPPTS